MKYFYPARGRKCAFSDCFCCCLETSHSPQGDGNHSCRMICDLLMGNTLYPARGRKLELVSDILDDLEIPYTLQGDGNLNYIIFSARFQEYPMPCKGTKTVHIYSTGIRTWKYPIPRKGTETSTPCGSARYTAGNTLYPARGREHVGLVHGLREQLKYITPVRGQLSSKGA